jgi:uncharacterized protein with PIN domain
VTAASRLTTAFSISRPRKTGRFSPATKRNIEDQLAELREAGVELAVAETPTRCGRCNGSLLAVDATEETPEYAPDPDDTDCWRCRECGQLFWKGSHWKRMKETLN